MLRSLRLRIRAFFAPARVRAELDDELRFHMEEQARIYMREGIPADEAARRARLRFGIMEATANPDSGDRDANNAAELLRDVRYAARALWRDRGLAVAGVLTLALGIGATTAVFSAVNAVMLRELPFANADRLVRLRESNPERGWSTYSVSHPNFLDWRARNQSFEAMAASADASLILNTGADIDVVRGAAISAEPVFVTLPLSYRKDQRVLIGPDGKQEPVPLTVLGERARQMLVSRATKQVYLRMDAGMNAQEFLTVMDTLKDGGVEAGILRGFVGPNDVERIRQRRLRDAGAERVAADDRPVVRGCTIAKCYYS